MKFLDKVKVINLRDSYKNENISLNEIGVIWESEIRDNCFYVMFDDDSNKKFYDEKPGQNFFKYCTINIKDLELVKNNNTPDNLILEALPKNNPKWWCKVEDGYIKNLLGETKNKIPYDYDS